MTSPEISARLPRRTKEEWRKLIKDFDHCDLSTTDYCNANQLSHQSFLKWRSTFRSENRNTKPAKIIAQPFVELTPEPKAPIQNWSVELAIGDNITLRIR